MRDNKGVGRRGRGGYVPSRGPREELKRTHCGSKGPADSADDTAEGCLDEGPG